MLLLQRCSAGPPLYYQNRTNSRPPTTVQNDKKEIVDLYIPKKCSWSNRLIHSQDKGAVQFRIAHVGKEGYAIKGQYTYVALSGKTRANGEADMAINELAKEVPGLYL